MGAEQVGFLCKGPVKIPVRKVGVAVRACRRLRQELLALTGSDAARHERMNAALSETGEYLDPEDIPANPEQEIRAFRDWWHHIEGRDTCVRDDPDNCRQKLVFAGEMSWGDEPQGYGYQMLKQAFAWGYAEALGIR